MTSRLIIFDCDGTLVDSQHAICAAMEMCFAGEGLAAPARAAILGIVGLSLPEAFLRLGQGMPECPPDDVLCRLTEGYRQAFSRLRQDPAHDEPMFPGVLDGIRALAARDGTLLGIATGKSRRGVDRLLDRVGLADCFATIRTADDAPSKPHPAMIEQAMAETGARRAATAMIGDTTFDIEMARNARVAGYGVAWGYHPPEALEAAGARAVATDFVDLLAAIDAREQAAAVE